MFAPTLIMLAAGWAAPPFGTPITVPIADRLAITPKIDGKIDAEEWDELTQLDNGKGYFEWEPMALHAAATLPVGEDLLLSFDLRNDGWLIGRDNMEVRVRMTDGLPDVQVRLLDGTGAAGPAWRDGSAFQASAKAAATSDGTNWTVEVTLRDPGKMMLIADADRTIGVRMDTVGSEEGSHEPYLPRAMTPIRLVLDRTLEMPEGIKFKPEYKGRSVIPGDNTQIRLTFQGRPETAFKRIEVRSEGLVRDYSAMVGNPFPEWDTKNRAFVDYKTRVAPEADTGYRVVRATLTDAEGKESIVQSSYEVANAVSFDMVPPKFSGSDKVQRIKVPVYLQSNVGRRLDGIVTMTPPEGWEVKNGNDEAFIVYNSRGRIRKVFELVVPADAKGPYAFKMRANLGTRIVEETVWLTVP